MTTPRYLAHFNWSIMRAPVGDPLVGEFVAALDKVNTIAERSDGFVWRHGRERDAALTAQWPLFTRNPTMIASFSVWQSPDALHAFVHKTVHGAFLRRGAEWFAPGTGVNYALWWVPVGHVPDIGEARTNVEHMLAHGAGDAVFDFATLRTKQPQVAE